MEVLGTAIRTLLPEIATAAYAILKPNIFVIAGELILAYNAADCSECGHHGKS